METLTLIILLWLFSGVVITYYTELKPAFRAIDFGQEDYFTLADLVELIMFVLSGPIHLIRHVLDNIDDINLFKVKRDKNGRIKIN